MFLPLLSTRLPTFISCIVLYGVLWDLQLFAYIHFLLHPNIIVCCQPPFRSVVLPHTHSIGRLPAPPYLPQDPERFPSEDDLQVVLDEISEYREFQ